MEDKLTREIVNLDPISRGSLVNYIEKLTVEIENEINKVLPSKFGVMLGGWTDNGTSTQYIAVFACFSDKKTKQATFPLLAFSPSPDEELFDADVHKLFNCSWSKQCQYFQHLCRQLRFLWGKRTKFVFLCLDAILTDLI